VHKIISMKTSENVGRLKPPRFWQPCIVSHGQILFHTGALSLVLVVQAITPLRGIGSAHTRLSVLWAFLQQHYLSPRKMELIDWFINLLSSNSQHNRSSLIELHMILQTTYIHRITITTTKLIKQYTTKLYRNTNYNIDKR